MKEIRHDFHCEGPPHFHVGGTKLSFDVWCSCGHPMCDQCITGWDDDLKKFFVIVRPCPRCGHKEKTEEV